MLIKFASPKAAQLGFLFNEENLFKDTLMRIERENAQNPAGIEPTTYLLRGMHSTEPNYSSVAAFTMSRSPACR